MADNLNSYDLSRSYFDWCFENPEKVSPNHTAIYFFAIEHCNRLGWKEKFGFPTQMAMDAIGIKKNQTYIRYFNDLVDWGFFKLVEKSKNQYSANIISLQSAIPKNGKALDKALIKHTAKQDDSMGLGIRQSNSPIDKQLTKNNKQRTIELPFSSVEFVSAWETLISQPKWKKKTVDALSASVKKLNGVSELYALKMIENAIAGNWQGIFKLDEKDTAEVNRLETLKKIKERDNNPNNKF